MATGKSTHKVQGLSSTGNQMLDALLDQAPPQVLAAAYAVSTLAYRDGDWNNRLQGILSDRVAQLRETLARDLHDDSPDGVLAPRWLAFADGVKVGCDIEQ